MNVVINGATQTYGGGEDLASLVREFGARSGRVAVMVNGAVVPREQWNQRRVTEGDRVEIVTFMGGG